MRSNQLLLYGANGYTGKLILSLINDYQVYPLIAGRNKREIKVLAECYQLSFETLELSESRRLHQLLERVSVVLHVAGPFRHTARPMMEACIHTSTHYIDITGEIEVFEMAKQYDRAAKEAGIMLLPGAGFDVVPTDCLALYLKKKMPAATHLSLAFANIGGGVSHGTAMTMIEGLGEGGASRENGQIIRKPLGHSGRWIDFGVKKLFVMAIPWGDVSTAFHTTGIPSIETYTSVKPVMFRLLKFQFLFNRILKSQAFKAWLKKKVKRRAAGPSDESRQNARALVWGEVKDDQGTSMTARIETPDGYTLTAHSSLLIAGKILRGNYKPGYQTPGSAYGADLVFEIPGVKRIENI